LNAGLKPPSPIFITRASASVLVTVAPLGRLYLRQLLQRRADALFTVFGRPLLGSLRPAAARPRIVLGALLDFAHQLPGLGQVLLQAGLPAERRRTGVGPHPHAVLRHALQADRCGRRQRRHVGRQHFVHQCLVARAEVVERVVVHRYPAAQPAVGVVLARQPCHLAPAAHAFEHRVQPQREQDARVDRSAPSVAASRLDRIGQPAQVLLLDVAPPHPCTVILALQRLQVRRTQLDLAAVGLQQPDRALALGGHPRLPRCLLVFPPHCRQVLKQTARRLALVFVLTHSPE
jgi:hypothetical protein